MTQILNFLDIKPTFTIKGLRIVWYAFLVERAMELSGWVLGFFRAYSTINAETTFYYLMNILLVVVVAFLVRLLIEIAVVSLKPA